MREVEFACTNGSVKIIQYISGDADGDGETSLKDVVLITRYLAGWGITVDLDASDVNKDGEVSLKDVVMIRRYLAGGWNIELN